MIPYHPSICRSSELPLSRNVSRLQLSGPLHPFCTAHLGHHSYRSPQIIAGKNTTVNPIQISPHAPASSQARTMAGENLGGLTEPAKAPEMQRQRNDSGQDASTAIKKIAATAMAATCDFDQPGAGVPTNPACHCRKYAAARKTRSMVAFQASMSMRFFHRGKIVNADIYSFLSP